MFIWSLFPQRELIYSRSSYKEQRALTNFFHSDVSIAMLLISDQGFCILKALLWICLRHVRAGRPSLRLKFDSSFSNIWLFFADGVSHTVPLTFLNFFGYWKTPSNSMNTGYVLSLHFRTSIRNVDFTSEFNMLILTRQEMYDSFTACLGLSKRFC